MIVYNNRTNVGSYAQLDTKSFSCFVSTARGIFRGSTIVLMRTPDGTAKLPPVAKAYLKPLMTKDGRDRVHDYVLTILNEVGERPHEALTTYASGERQRLIYSVEGTFELAKARRYITSFILDKRKK